MRSITIVLLVLATAVSAFAGKSRVVMITVDPEVADWAGHRLD